MFLHLNVFLESVLHFSSHGYKNFPDLIFCGLVFTIYCSGKWTSYSFSITNRKKVKLSL
jgi:hypothetical protein